MGGPKGSFSVTPDATTGVVRDTLQRMWRRRQSSGSVEANKKTLYLHIGGQKTGSTAFQSYLSRLTPTLNSQVFLRILPSEITPGLDTNVLWQNIDLEVFGRELSQKICDSDSTTFLLSSELLCHLQFEQLSSITRQLKDVNLVWIFVHREPSRVLLSHWADRATLFGDTFDFVDYVPMRIKSPFINGRHGNLFEEVRSGDLELHQLGTKFAKLSGTKKLLVYSPNVVSDLLGHIIPSYQIENDQSRDHRVHTSPGIATTYLCMEYLKDAVKSLGVPIRYQAVPAASKLVRGFLSPIDFSTRTSQVNVSESLYLDFPFLRPDISRFVNEFAWEIIERRHPYEEGGGDFRVAVDYRKLKNNFLKEVEEVRRQVDYQQVIRLAVDSLISLENPK